jgi:wobble nucleotide-excising tRNase
MEEKKIKFETMDDILNKMPADERAEIEAGAEEIAQAIRLKRQENCIHDWEFDGQTLMANRWTCNLCGKRKMD